MIALPRLRSNVTPASASLRRSCFTFLRLSCENVVQEIGEVAVAGVGPVELHARARNHAERFALARLVLRQEQDVQRGKLCRAHEVERVREHARGARRASRASMRGPDTGVNGTAAHELRVVAAAVAAIGLRPAPVEDVFAVAVRLGVQRQRADERAARPRRSGSAASIPSRGVAQPVSCSALRNACARNGWPRRKRVPVGGRDAVKRDVVANRRATPPPASAWRRRGRENAWRRILAIVALLQARASRCARATSRCANIRRMRLAIAQLDQRVGDLAGQRARHPRRRRRGPARAARRWSSPRSFRSAAIRPKTSCCVPRSSTPARASLRPWPRAGRADVTVVVGFPEARDGALYNAAAVLRDGRVRAGLSQAGAAELHGVRRRALLRAGHGALRVRRRRRARAASSSARTSGSRSPRRSAQAPARRSSSCRTARRITRGSRRCAASRSMRARARERLADRLRQSRRRPGRARVRRRVVRRRRGRARWRSRCRRGTRRSRIADFDGARAAAGARRARSGAGAARLRGAGHGRARLCRQERLSRRAARAVRRRRLGADARGRGRRARPRPRARA